MTSSGPLQELCHDEPVLALCGFSGSGKTTLLEQALPRLGARGLRVAVVKHDVHGITVDPSGTDSARLFAAGGDVVLRGPEQSLQRCHERGEQDLAAVLLDLLAAHDLVLVEGYKSYPHDKMEVHRAAVGKPLMAPENPSIVAVATDTPDALRRDLPALDLPMLDLNDEGAIADFVIARCGLLEVRRHGAA